MPYDYKNTKEIVSDNFTEAYVFVLYLLFLDQC